MKLRYKLLIYFLTVFILSFGVRCFTLSVRVKAFSYQGEIPTPIAQILVAVNFSCTLQNFSSVFTMDNLTYEVQIEYADVIVWSYETIAFIDLHIRNLSIRGAVELAFSKLDLYLIIVYGQEEGDGDFLLTAYTEIPLWEFILSHKYESKVKKIGGIR